MTTARRPEYIWDRNDEVIEDAIAHLCDQLASSGCSDEVIDLYVLDFLEAAHKRYPEKVRVKGKPDLRLVVSNV